MSTRHRVPPEFIGKARSFRDRIVAADDVVTATSETICKKLAARMRRKPTFRKTDTTDLLRCWQIATATYGSRGQPVLTSGKRNLLLTETRLNSLRMRDPEWDTGTEEFGIGLSNFSILAADGAITQNLECLVTFGLHALARYFQRSFLSNNQALLDAIWHVGALREEAMEVAERAGGVSIACPHTGGRWSAVVVTSIDAGPDLCKGNANPEVRPGLAVRTFLPDRGSSDE